MASGGRTLDRAKGVSKKRETGGRARTLLCHRYPTLADAKASKQWKSFYLELLQIDFGEIS
jgi:hypothetical protein